MKLYNTLTRQKEKFRPLDPAQVSIYACGPTVYNFIHIGNARPICVFDVLRRYLEFSGYKVKFVQNFTDIDDKIINRANEEGEDWQKLAQRYTEEYKRDAAGLLVKPATTHPKATECVSEIVQMVERLVEKGFAYAAKNGDVYFRTRKFPEYGKLSGQNLDELEAGARVDVSELKQDPLDFALWKASKPGEPCWDSPWGKGRPGWHIECSAMAKKFLGEQIDIHCGGADLIFPHHENEIAQSECCSGTEFANFWLHNGYINIDNRKMSKSLGNFFTVREVAEKHGYGPIRYLMIASHYRRPVSFSEEILEQCKVSLTRLRTCRESLQFAISTSKNSDEKIEPSLKNEILASRQAFVQAMDDDLNTADALAALFDLARKINTCLGSESSVSRGAMEFMLQTFDELTGVLGLDTGGKEAAPLEAEIRELILEREEARRAKNWALADEIRDELARRSVVLEDTPHGVKFSIKE